MPVMLGNETKSMGGPVVCQLCEGMKLKVWVDQLYASYVRE